MTVEAYNDNLQGSDSIKCKDFYYSPGIVEDLSLSQLKESQLPIRKSDLYIEQLAQSIREKGLLQAIIVRPKEGYFEIVAGNRRFNACNLLGWRKMSCHIVELNDKDAFEVSLIENVQRETMNPLEEAAAFKKYVAEFGWGSNSELAQKIGKSPSYVSKRISLLDLPSDVLEMIKSMEIRPSVAEELLRANKETQSELARLISTRHLSMRQVRGIVEDNVQNFTNDIIEYSPSYARLERAERGYDKAIASLRLALSKLADIIEDFEDDWIVHMTLLQHKNALHSQIDILMKEKRNQTKIRSYP